MIRITLILLFLFTSCSTLNNNIQESKFMKVSTGGYVVDTDRQMEEAYMLEIYFKNLPQNVKYIIADFESPANRGIYDRKVYPINSKHSKILIKSNPIYGVKKGLYKVKILLSEDERGEKIIDSLIQGIQMINGISKGRDYAVQYTLLSDNKELKKVLVIYPNNRKKNLISAEISDKFKIGHAAVTHDELVTEYVPFKETVYNWTRIITLLETKQSSNYDNKPSTLAALTGKGFYNKFFKFDKDMQITYTAINNGSFINTETPDFENLMNRSDEVWLYTDYFDYLTAKEFPNQREYLVIKFIKSDISVWQLQCTVRYDKRWSLEKIKTLKSEAIRTVSSMQYIDKDPIKTIEESSIIAGIKNFNIKIQRLDDRDLNEKYKATQKSPYEKKYKKTN